jgi:hypothetical protein
VLFEKTIWNMKDIVHGRPCGLDFHVDLAGCSDWQDCSEESVTVSISVKGKLIHQRINRSPKHVAPLRYVAAAGDLMLFCVAVASKLNMNLWKDAEMIQQTPLVIVENTKWYINASLFEDFVARVFAASYNWQSKSSSRGTESRPVIGGLSTSCFGRFKRFLDRAERRPLPRLLAPNIFQILYPNLFGAFKILKNGTEKADGGDRPVIDQFSVPFNTHYPFQILATASLSL